ncbi:MAG: hypothetical protein ACRCY4_05450 [Brevinema sp.]
MAPVKFSSSFVSNLVSGNYYMVEYSSEDTGEVFNTGDVDDMGDPITTKIFRDVARTSTTDPLQLTASSGQYTGGFVHNNITYTFEHQVDANTAIYSYVFFGRSAETANTAIRAYIGFRTQNNGLYTLGKKNWDMGVTLQSTINFYSRENIDTSTIEGGPLYQKFGTTPEI